MSLRFHARFPAACTEGLDAPLHDPRAVAVRVEPVRTIDGPAYLLDVTLAHRDGTAVIAAIALDRDALALRDRSPYVFPAAAANAAGVLPALVAAIDGAVCDAFTREAEPRERLIVLDAASADALHARRERAALGAAPYHAVMAAAGRAVAPGDYAEIVLGEQLPSRPPYQPASFGDEHAPQRCYLALSDAALRGGAALRAAHDLAAALVADGAAVDVGGYDGRSLDPYAAVHAIGLDDALAARELIESARACGRRAVLTPLWDDAPDGGFWGASAHVHALRAAYDEAQLTMYRALVRDRAIGFVDGLSPHALWEPQPSFLANARAALGAADAVAVGCAREAQRLRERFGIARNYVPWVPLARDGAVAAGGDAVVSWNPLTPLHGGATLARAAARAGIPLVLAGPVVDGAYAARARSYLGTGPVFVAAPARACVAADVSWTGTDYGALADAAAQGIPLVVSSRSDAAEIFGAHGVFVADPGDEDAIAQALAHARALAQRGGAELDALAQHARTRFRADVLQACVRLTYAPQPSGVA